MSDCAVSSSSTSSLKAARASEGGEEAGEDEADGCAGCARRESLSVEDMLRDLWCLYEGLCIISLSVMVFSIFLTSKVFKIKKMRIIEQNQINKQCGSSPISSISLKFLFTFSFLSLVVFSVFSLFNLD